MVDFVYNTEVDMIECAMWWELPEPGAGSPQSDQPDTLRYLGTR